MPEQFLESLEAENRRIEPRYQMNLPVVLNGRSSTTINISLSGLRYISPQPLNQGSVAYLKVYFGEERVNLVTETVWSERVGAGSVVGATFRAGSDLDRLARHLRRASARSVEPQS